MGRAGAARHGSQADNHGHWRTANSKVGRAVRRSLDPSKLVTTTKSQVRGPPGTTLTPPLPSMHKSRTHRASLDRLFVLAHRQLSSRQARPLLSPRVGKLVEPVTSVARNLLEANLSPIELSGDCLNELPILDRRTTTGTHSLASPAFKPLREDANDVCAISLDEHGLGFIKRTKQLQDGTQFHTIIGCMGGRCPSFTPIFRHPCPPTRPGVATRGTVCCCCDCHRLMLDEEQWPRTARNGQSKDRHGHPNRPCREAVGPRCVRTTPVTYGQQRSSAVTDGSEEPQVVGPPAQAAGMMHAAESDCGPEGQESRCLTAQSDGPASL